MKKENPKKETPEVFQCSKKRDELIQEKKKTLSNIEERAFIRAAELIKENLKS